MILPGGRTSKHVEKRGQFKESLSNPQPRSGFLRSPARDSLVWLYVQVCPICKLLIVQSFLLLQFQILPHPVHIRLPASANRNPVQPSAIARHSGPESELTSINISILTFS